MSMKTMFLLSSLLSGVNADTNETAWLESNFEPESLYAGAANFVSTEGSFSVEKDVPRRFLQKKLEEKNFFSSEAFGGRLLQGSDTAREFFEQASLVQPKLNVLTNPVFTAFEHVADETSPGFTRFGTIGSKIVDALQNAKIISMRIKFGSRLYANQLKDRISERKDDADSDTDFQREVVRLYRRATTDISDMKDQVDAHIVDYRGFLASLSNTVSSYNDGDERKNKVEMAKMLLPSLEETKKELDDLIDSVILMWTNLAGIVDEEARTKAAELERIAEGKADREARLAVVLNDLQVVGDLTRAFANNPGHDRYQGDINDIMSLLSDSVEVETIFRARTNYVSNTLTAIMDFEGSSDRMFIALSDFNNQVTKLTIQNNDLSLTDEALAMTLWHNGQNVDAATSAATKMQEQSRHFFNALNVLISNLRPHSSNPIVAEALEKVLRAKELYGSVVNKQNALVPAVEEIATEWREFRAQHP